MKYKNIKKAEALLLSLCLILVFAVGSVIAYLADATSDVNNTFAPADIKIEIKETVDNPLSTKEDVFIKNTDESDAPAFIRVAIVVNWSTENEQHVYSTVPVLGEDYTLDLDLENKNEEDLGTEKGMWHYREADGYYYYDKPVQIGSDTTVLINSCTQKKVGPEKGAYTLNVHILAQGIQAVGQGVTESSEGQSTPQIIIPVVDSWGFDPSTNWTTPDPVPDGNNQGGDPD